MSNKLLKEVADADKIVLRIKGKKTEDQIIEEQRNREPEDEPEEEEHTCYVHSLDDHHHSYIFTPVDSGIFRGETTYTPMLERKKRR